MQSTNRVLVLSADAVGRTMAGPAIRSVELSRQLARDCRVTLASSHPAMYAPSGVTTTTFSTRRSLESLARSHDVIIGMSGQLSQHPWLGSLSAAVVADAYDPVLFEVLELFGEAPRDEQLGHAAAALDQMTAALRFADLVLCASERQRLLTIGMLTALGRVNPATYHGDPRLERLVRVVPFGLPAAAPESPGARPLRGGSGPFGEDDFILLWGGGMYQWLDPLTLIEAMAHIADPRVKVVFLAGDHPTPGTPDMSVARDARSLAEERGLLGSRVAFVDTWIPYDDRAEYLLDCDVGVSLHRNHLETVFAFRTRILDYVWAGLPILCSDGDSFADLVRERGLGEVVTPGDPQAIAEAVERLRHRYDERRSAVRRVAGEFTWERVAQPLRDFCRDPEPAADRARNNETRLTGLFWAAARRSRAAARRLRRRTNQ